MRRGLSLVYGGAKVGLMGAVADSVLKAGGEVIGVIPEGLVAKEVAHQGLSELRVVSSMHERKRQMSDLADGFIALPGGMGTIEELTEILTWAQLGMHGKPAGILNVAGYFDHLLKFMDHAVSEQFLKEIHRKMMLVTARPEEMIDLFKAYQAPMVDKWVNRKSV